MGQRPSIVSGVGGASGTRPPSTRRYSRASGFSHNMDNIRDKKLIKIKLRQTSEMSGNFSLSYTDDSSDDFLNIKSTFTYTGKYIVEGKPPGPGESFGVGIITTAKGDVVTGDAALLEEGVELEMAAVPIKGGKDMKNGGVAGKRSESLLVAGGTTTPRNALAKLSEKPTTNGMSTKPESSSRPPPPPAATTTTTPPNGGGGTAVSAAAVDTGVGKPPVAPRRVSAATPKNIRTTKFVTDRLTCKLVDGSISSYWVIEPSEKPDCDAQCAWSWEGTLSRATHTAPPDALNFLGQEDIETGSIDLRMRIPQLAAGWNPPVVVLNEMTGWKLDKKSW